MKDEPPIKDILQGVTKKGLQEISQELGLHSHSKMSQPELVNFILNSTPQSILVLDIMQRLAIRSNWQDSVMREPWDPTKEDNPPLILDQHCFLQREVSFKRKVAKSGPEHIFVIPRFLIRNGYIKPGTTYEVFLKEVPDEKDESDAGAEDK